ncbi:MAG: phosphate acyltransferase PlsX [bacterium]
MSSFRVALDVMGGDNAPEVELQGARKALREDRIDLLLVGPEDRIRDELSDLPENSGSYEVLHASEYVRMDENPVEAVRKKKDASLLVAADAVEDGRADVLVSAGNTGAVMAATKIKWGVQKKIDRPAIGTLLPVVKERGGHNILIDAGANVDSTPLQLAQFGLMGKVFSETVLSKNNATVGLLNVGGEARKGNNLTRDAYDLLKNQPYDFVGNIEGGEIVKGAADVIVCDGFVGNVALKVGEGVTETLFSFLRQKIKGTLRGKLGGWLLKPIFKSLKGLVDPSEYGGAPLLGLREGCIIAHGSSSPKAIKNALGKARLLVENNCNQVIGERIGTLNLPES